MEKELKNFVKKKIRFFTYGSKDSDWSINKIHHHRTHYLVSMLILGRKYFLKQNYNPASK